MGDTNLQSWCEHPLIDFAYDNMRGTPLPCVSTNLQLLGSNLLKGRGHQSSYEHQLIH